MENNTLTKEQWIEKVSISLDNPITIQKYNHSFTYNTALFEVPIDLQDDYSINRAACLFGKEKISNLSREILKNKDFLIEFINKHSEDRKEAVNALGIYADDDVFYTPEVLKTYMSHPKNKLSVSLHRIEERNYVLNVLPYIDFVNLDNWYKEERALFNKLYKNDFEVQKLSISLYNSRGLNELKSKKPKWYKQLIEDKSYVIDFLSNAKFYSTEMNEAHIKSLFRDLSKEFKNDLDIIDILLKKNKHNISLISEDIKNNKDFAKKSIEEYDLSLREFGYDVKMDYDINKLYLNKQPDYFRNCLIKNAEFARMTMKHLNYDINILDASLLNDKELVLEFFNAKPENITEFFKKINTQDQNAQYPFLPNVLLEDYDIMKIAILKEPTLIKNSKVTSHEKELALLAFNESEDLNLLPLKYFNINETRDILLESLKSVSGNISKFLNNSVLYENFKEDTEIIKHIISTAPNFIQHFYFAQSDKELVNFALDKGLKEISLIDPALLSDKEMALKFIAKNLTTLNKLPLHLRNDMDIAINVSTVDYKNYIKTTQLSQNVEFHLKLVHKNPRFYEILDENSQVNLKNNEQLFMAYLEHCNDTNKTPIVSVEILNKYNVEDPNELLGYINADKLIKVLNHTDVPSVKTQKKKI